ncbi:MAG: Holliday junction branch migration protein RuvA [Bacteroidales bacterium]|nr:Holliday junction branch migration protein RuvA [Bacteroidales bacterium]
MFEYIKGTLVEKNPAYCIIEAGGMGYFINISLTTFGQIQHMEQCKLLLHQVIREDAHHLFGFFSASERELFRQLVTVSGIGANTARMILSSLQPDELRSTITTGNTVILQNIKGIGLKTAQRILVELRDKVSSSSRPDEIVLLQNNTIREEALSALVTLGFSKNAVEKVITGILLQDKTVTLEELIKKALKQF